jgi:site-specific recombinase XerD
VALLITTSVGSAVNRKWFSPDVWQPALPASFRGRDNGVHALRHFYASSLLHAGESVKALSEYLGHHDAGFTFGRTRT